MVRRYIYFIVVFFAPCQHVVQASILHALDDALKLEGNEVEVLSGAKPVSAGKYFFDESFFIGTSLEGVDVEKLNSPILFLPGIYRVDVVLGSNVLGRLDVEFVQESSEAVVEPCFTKEYLVSVVGVKASAFKEGLGEGCQPLSVILPDSSFDFNVSELKLSLIIPQAVLDIKPIGYVPSTALVDGETMVFVNYDSSAYKSESSGSSSKYAYLSIGSGFNIGMWRFRNFSSVNYNDSYRGSESSYNNIRSYVQRALPGIESELTIGDNFTSSNLFGGVNYRGISLATDQRMWAPGQAAYAPEVRGVAATTARVIVRQAGRIIQEVNVAPGPFIIDDLSGFSQAGDFDVEVVEADGSVSTFVVPYASVPESMRPGKSKYSFDLGQVRGHDSDYSFFSDITYQKGISNSITANTGLRVAEDYVAILAGGVWSSQYGALGLNTTYSNAKVERGQRKQGWRIGLNYSKTIDFTDTSIGLAGYRYSSEGFRELLDVMGARNKSDLNEDWNSSTFMQRNQLTISLSQPLGDYGSLYVSGSASDYYDGRSRNTQFQAGYSNSWRDVSYSLTWSRQNYLYYSDYLGVGNDVFNPASSSSMSNSVTFSVSMPLGTKRNSPYVNSLITSSSGETRSNRFQAGVNGSIGDQQPVNYSISSGYDDANGSSFLNSGISSNMPYANVSASYSKGDGYSQYGGSLGGSVVGHSGGITFGPRLSDTFALIEAKGAQGARVNGHSGARVDYFGYALVSSLSPYRYNNVGLTPADSDYMTEFLETEVEIAPYAGSAVKVKFETLTGFPVLISAVQDNGASVPLGASVYNEEGVEVGMVGQGGQIYARAKEGSGVLLVKWGSKSSEQCLVKYFVKDAPANTVGIIKLDLVCQVEI